MEYELKKSLDESIQVMLLENEYTAMRHTHNFLELVYIVSGTAGHHLGDTEGVLGPGDYFVVDYNTSHDYLSPCRDLTIINCLFLPEFLDKNFEGENSFNRLTERYFLRITGRRVNGPASNQVFNGDQKIRGLFFKMLEEYNLKKEGYSEMLRFLLCQIIIETARTVGSKKSLSRNTESIIKIIDKQYNTNLSLSKICKDMHYSLPYISAHFKKDTGISFSEYLQNRRIEEACRLLRETDMSVTEISEAVGYSSIKFFGSVFKKVTGLTPREYRKNEGPL